MSAADARYIDDYFAQLRPELRPLLKLPRAEPPKGVRARMAEFLKHRFAFAHVITRDDLEAAGFTEREIAQHFHPAKRIARLAQMVV